MAHAAYAQDARGTILGRISDASGAVIPDVEVQVTNPATGVSLKAKTNRFGNYVLPYLIPGVYNLSIEQTGFKKYSQTEIQVRINDSVQVDVSLQLGNVNESVQVTAETPLLSTAESSLGQVVDERRVMELPLFAGNAMDLVHLAPGTLNGTDMRLRKAPFNNAPSQFSTDGSGNYQNEFTIDGVSNTFSSGTSARVAFSPPQTAIGEFKIQTSAFDASLGHTIGSVVNVSTKSGTNDLHGEAHYWLRHSMWDAPTIFQNRSGQKIAVYQDHRYGVSGGGPVVIPKIYDGRNKTFFFHAWEANKFGDPSVGQSTSTVPTQAMRNGDFSALLALGPGYQIYDPLTTQQLANGRFQRTPFAGNIIPANRIDPVGRAIANAWPLPNQATTNAEGRNNYFESGKAIEDYWVHLFRADHTFTENHRMFFRLHRDYWEEDKNRRYGRNGVNGIILNRINRGVSFDDVYVFSPTFLLNIRYGLTQQEFPERRVTQGLDLASLGFSQNLISQLPNPSLAAFPNVEAGYLTALSDSEGGDGTTTSLTHSLTGTITKLQGDHNIRMGGEVRIYREFNARYSRDVSPSLRYNATYTRLNDTSANPTVGGEFASLLLGIPAGDMNRSASYAEQDKYYGLYIHDDWKITRKLTLNLGIRYELESPITERFNRSVAGFAFDEINPINAQARANYTQPLPERPLDQFVLRGGLTFVGANGNSRNYWNGEKNNFMPRFGFAYQVLPKTVIRGGYGLFYGSIGVNNNSSIQAGFSQTTPIQASLDNGLTYYASNANPFPAGLIPPPGAAGGLSTSLGQGITFFDRDRKQPYAQRWSMGFQQELPMQWVAEASYVGNKNVRLGVNRNINATPEQYLSRSLTRDQATIDYLGAQFNNPFFGIASVAGQGQRTSRSQLLRPYPQFGDINVNLPIGYSWYHSLQTRLEKRFSQGYTIQSSYTWSKSMNANSFLNATDAALHEVISDLDRPHRITGSGIWELPFGKGRKWGADWHPALNFVAGGWQLNGVVQKQSGPPLGFGNRVIIGDLSTLVLPKDQRSPDRWFNTTLVGGVQRPVGYFLFTPGEQPANNIRTAPERFSQLRSDGQSRWDVSLIKDFRVTEQLKTRFRAECFNVGNHPNLRGVNTDPTSAAFGTVTAQDPPRSWQFALQLTF